MSVSPTSAAARTASPAGIDSLTRPALSPLVLAVGSEDADTLRRPSVQFIPHFNTDLPRGSPKQGRDRRRISSPPPPPVFQPRVSFDTFDKPADFIDENSFTLVTKHKDYEYTKRSRTFLCGCDDNEYSDYALQWLIDELVDDGDEIVCLRVVEKDDTIAGDQSVQKGHYRAQAESLMKKIQGRNHENKAINLILEFAVGKVNKVIDEMINLYEPAILVVGTRGRSLGGFQGLLPGSVSKYCLQHSPVPVIVVRPSSKRDKARQKRSQDPNRHGYKEILEKSGHLLDVGNNRDFIAEESVPASDDEAAAVAAAIGYKPAFQGSPLVQAQSAPADPKTERVPSIADDMKSPGIVMKSPVMGNLDSPDISDSGSSSEDEGGVPTSPELTGRSAADRAAQRDHHAAEADSNSPKVREEEPMTIEVNDPSTVKPEERPVKKERKPLIRYTEPATTKKEPEDAPETGKSSEAT